MHEDFYNFDKNLEEVLRRIADWLKEHPQAKEKVLAVIEQDSMIHIRLYYYEY